MCNSTDKLKETEEFNVSNFSTPVLFRGICYQEFSYKVRKVITSLIVILLATSVTNSKAQDSWLQIAGFGGTARSGATGFSIGTKGYIGTGRFIDGYKKDFWEYDPVANTWTQKADFGGPARENAVGFSIGNFGYIGTGYFWPYLLNDFWEYDPALNTWMQKADFGGSARYSAVGFSIGSKGYLGTGYDGIYPNYYQNDFWEYDQPSNSWTKKADFKGKARADAVGFSIGSNGYVGTGVKTKIRYHWWNSNYLYHYNRNFWEYDPATDSWTKKAKFGGSIRAGAVGFSIGNKGYIGTGYEDYENTPVLNKKDFWEYDPATNSWKQRTEFTGSSRSGAVGFSINDKGYVGTGVDSLVLNTDFWEYTPNVSIAPCDIPTSLSTTNLTTTSSKLQWDAISGIKYKVRYKIAGTPEWNTTQTTDNNKAINGLAPSTEYAWQVKSICSTEPIVSSEWSEKQFFTTDPLRLTAAHESMLEVYPNPVSQSVTVSFSLSESSPVVIEIKDVNGRSLKVIADENFSEGNHEITFHRESLIAGIYFLQLKTNEGVMMRKIVIE